METSDLVDSLNDTHIDSTIHPNSALAEARSEDEKWKTKATAFEAQIIQSGMATVADMGDKTVELAAVEYPKEGTKAGKSKLASIRAWINRFVEHFGEDTLIQELTVDKVKTIKKEPFDGRTLRRTCGKELLLVPKSIDQVAAVLRDNPATVRKYYART